MIRIQISDDALNDLNEGFLFYEAQDRGLGDYFVSCLRSDIERLKISAGTHKVVYKGFRHFSQPRLSLRRLLQLLWGSSRSVGGG